MKLYCNEKQVHVVKYLLEWYILNLTELLGRVEKAENERKEYEEIKACLEIPRHIAKDIHQDIDTFIETNCDEDERWHEAEDLKNAIEVKLFKLKYGEINAK